jgi:vitamin B12 transporter
MRLPLLTAGALTLAMASAATAQDETTNDDVTVLDTITVTTANRTPTEAQKVGSTVEVLTPEDIDNKTVQAVGDYLAFVPGLSVSPAGPIGQTTGVYMRGLPGRYIKTLYNGIDVSDVSNTQVQTHFEHLLSAGISRIEVLKGSQSTLYGSNAIAGLIDLSSFDDAGPGVQHTVELEGGSYGTVRGRYGISASDDASRISGNISGFRADGFSAAADGPEKDAYQNVTADVNLEHRFSEAFSVFGSALYIDTQAEYDLYGSDSSGDENLTNFIGGRAGFNLDLLDGRAKNTFSVQASRMDREISPAKDTFVGDRLKFDYLGSFELTERFTLQYGADHERQDAEIASSGAMAGAHDLTGVWAQGIFEPIDDLVLTAGLRHDEHSEYGGHTTYRGTGSYLFPSSGTRLHASVGTGFRAPSLYELYAPSGMGNLLLQPETSQGFDIGVEQTLLDGRLVADVTYFTLKVDNRIGWIDSADFVAYPWGGYFGQVTGETQSRGIEASLKYAVTDWLDVGGSYTYTKAANDAGVRSIRVPRHTLVISTVVRPAEKWTLSADLRYAADTLDSDFSSGSSVDVALDDYVLFNAKVAYQLNDNMQVYLRGENLFDAKYQTVLGYNTPGASAFVGMKAKF